MRERPFSFVSLKQNYRHVTRLKHWDAWATSPILIVNHTPAQCAQMLFSSKITSLGQENAQFSNTYLFAAVFFVPNFVVSACFCIVTSSRDILLKGMHSLTLPWISLFDFHSLLCQRLEHAQNLIPLGNWHLICDRRSHSPFRIYFAFAHHHCS